MTTLSMPPLTPAGSFTLAPHHLHLVVQAEAIPVPRARDPLRVLVTGSRDYADPGAVAAVLWGVALTHGPLFITEGGASGLDRLALEFAMAEDWSYQSALANWSGPCTPECHHGPRKRRGSYTYCPAAGVYRNQYMVDLGHDLCIGWFSGPRESFGTRDCLDRAVVANIPTFSVHWEPADLFGEGRWAIRRRAGNPTRIARNMTPTPESSAA